MAAESVFRRRGYHGASLNEVVTSAGVSKGGFYHHFPSKEALFVEVVERVLLAAPEGVEDDSVEADRSGPAAKEGPPAGPGRSERQLRDLFLAPLRRDLDYLPLLFDAIKASPLVRERVAGLYESYRARCQRVLDRGKREGAVREHLDTASWAFQIVASVEGAFLLSAVATDPQGRRDLADGLERLFETLWRVIRRIDI